MWQNPKNGQNHLFLCQYPCFKEWAKYFCDFQPPLLCSNRVFWTLVRSWVSLFTSLNEVFPVFLKWMFYKKIRWKLAFLKKPWIRYKYHNKNNSFREDSLMRVLYSLCSKLNYKSIHHRISSRTKILCYTLLFMAKMYRLLYGQYILSGIYGRYILSGIYGQYILSGGSPTAQLLKM